MRLVKGAYWDSEIKRTQELGLPDYPLFTRKAATDVSYLACARDMLKARNIYPAFATHKALTVATILSQLPPVVAETLAGVRDVVDMGAPPSGPFDHLMERGHPPKLRSSWAAPRSRCGRRTVWRSPAAWCCSTRISCGPRSGRSSPSCGGPGPTPTPGWGRDPPRWGFPAPERPHFPDTDETFI